MVPEIDIWRTAPLLIRQHGEDAEIVAAQRVDALWQREDYEGHAIWLRVKRALVELQVAAPRISSPVEPDKEECIRARKDKITASPRSDRPVHCLEFDGQGAQRHRDGSRPADLDDAIDTATIGQLTGLRVPVRRLGVVDHVRGAQSLPYPGGGSFRPPNQSQTA